MTVQWPDPDGTIELRPEAVAEPEAEPTTGRTSSWPGLPAPALVPISGLVWWVVGFFPWILGGLGHEQLGRIGSELAAVPVFASSVSALVVGAGIGGLAAGLVGLLGRGNRGARATAVSVGVLLALVVTLVQSRAALSETDVRVLNGLTAIVIVMTVVATGVGLLALTGRIGLGLALAGVAGAAPVWLVAVLEQAGLQGPGTYERVGDESRWSGAAVLAAALIVIGVRPAVRIVWWPVALLLAWVVGPTVTAASYIEPLLRPGMGLPGMLGEHISASLDVWRMAASTEARPLTPWIAAIVVAAVVASIVGRRGPRRGGEPEAADPPTA